MEENREIVVNDDAEIDEAYESDGNAALGIGAVAGGGILIGILAKMGWDKWVAPKIADRKAKKQAAILAEAEKIKAEQAAIEKVEAEEVDPEEA